MAFFIGLVMMYTLVWLVSLTGISTPLRDPAMRGVVAAAIMFVLVGISHFAKPDKLLGMIPANWPYREAMNYVSGAAEILLGIGLLFQPTRTLSAWGLIVLLVCVFPVNISVAISKPNAYNISRLFFQPVYIAWIYWFCLRQAAGIVLHTLR